MSPQFHKEQTAADNEKHYQLQGLMRLLAAVDDLNLALAKKRNYQGLIELTGVTILHVIHG